MSADRERGVTRAFVSLARNLADGVDPVDLLSGLAEEATRLLDVASTGILLADARHVLHVVAASSEATRALEVYQLQRSLGPVWTASAAAPRSVSPTCAPRPAGGHCSSRRPPDAAAGHRARHHRPVRHPHRPPGRRRPEPRPGPRLRRRSGNRAGQAATDSALVNEQLQTALNSRVLLEQAKGVLAQRGSLDMEEAFAVLRRYARDHNLRLTDVARAVSDRELPAQRLLDHATAREEHRLRR